MHLKKSPQKQRSPNFFSGRVGIDLSDSQQDSGFDILIHNFYRTHVAQIM